MQDSPTMADPRRPFLPSPLLTASQAQGTPRLPWGVADASHRALGFPVLSPTASVWSTARDLCTRGSACLPAAPNKEVLGSPAAEDVRSEMDLGEACDLETPQ